MTPMPERFDTKEGKRNIRWASVMVHTILTFIFFGWPGQNLIFKRKERYHELLA